MNHSTTLAAPVAEPGTRPRSFRRIAATVATAALAGGMLVAVAAPATAAAPAATTGTVTGGTFTWGVSGRVLAHLSTHTPSDGATDTAGVTTWSNGTGTVNTVTGASDVSYTGTAKYAFNIPNTTTEVYSVTLSDPEVVVDAAGNGKIIADVDYFVSAQGSTPIDTRSTDDVVVTRFTTGDGTGDTWTTDGGSATLADTPKWAGVIMPGSQDATDVGLTNGVTPLDGKSFAKEFLLALPSSLRAHFYASGTVENPTAANTVKLPDPFTETVEVVTPTLTVSSNTSTPENGLQLAVDGNGFRAVTKTGDAGVYIGLAVAGGITDYSSANMGSFLGTQYLMVPTLTTGAFSTTLKIAAKDLDPTKSYSIYTWQSHTHSNESQDTETPVTIDYAGFVANVEVGLTLASTSSVYGKSVLATATVPGATSGDVKFYAGESVLGTAAVNDKSVATLALRSTLSAGAKVITARFVGTDTVNPATSNAVTLKVAKATTSKVSISGKAFTKKTAPKLSLTIAKLNNGTYASGSVKIYKNSKLVKTVKITTAKKGKLTITLPKSTATFKVKATFVGSANVAAKSSTTAKVSVKK